MARRGNESEDEGIVEPAAIELLQQNYLETRNFVVDSVRQLLLLLKF